MSNIIVEKTFTDELFHLQPCTWYMNWYRVIELVFSLLSFPMNIFDVAFQAVEGCDGDIAHVTIKEPWCPSFVDSLSPMMLQVFLCFVLPFTKLTSEHFRLGICY